MPTGLVVGQVRVLQNNTARLYIALLNSYFWYIGACGGLFNVDGVRCWLPCIDSPRERAVFDCRIKCAIPKKLSDITPG